MPVSAKNGKYFWFLNFLVIIVVFVLSAQVFFAGANRSPYRVQLDQTPHYVTAGLSLEPDLSGATLVPAGQNVGLAATRRFLQPGEMPGQAFTITAKFDYTAQYDALMGGTGVTPGILLPGLGDSFEIYLNGHLAVSEWHVENGAVTVHKLARGAAYPLSPALFVRGQNTLVFLVFGDPTAFDTGLTVTPKYTIDDYAVIGRANYVMPAFAGIYCAVSVTFFSFFLLYREKKRNLWFALTAMFLSLYAFFRAGAFQSAIPNYALALRLEIVALFSFAYCVMILIYSCGRERFNRGMKFFTGLYAIFCAAVFLPGHQFVLDLTKLFLALFAPFVLYAFAAALCLPLAAQAKRVRQEGGSAPRFLLGALSGTLRGNMLIGSFMPIMLALFDQLAYVALSYQEVVLSQYGFLFFFVNVTFALASDNAEMHDRLIEMSAEFRALVDAREAELALKSGEIEQAISAQTRFREKVAREIRGPLGEIIGAIELRILRTGLTPDAMSWLKRLLEAERGLRKTLDGFLGEAGDGPAGGGPASALGLETGGARAGLAPADSPGGTRHLFVINPKSFVRLGDLKDFLLSIEMCFSAGHRAEYKIYISRYPRDAYSAVHRYLSATPPNETTRVYAVGGDGILFDCLNGLAKFPNAELAPIPYGNANDFVRAFGGENMALFRDIKRMSKAPSRPVDAILCGEQYALCSCSIGIEAAAVQVFSSAIERINASKARHFVPVLYKLGAIKALAAGALEGIHYRLHIDGTDLSDTYTFINVGNIALNGGDNTPNPHAVPDDGLLDVITCTSPSLVHSLRMLPAYTTGLYGKFPDHLRHRRFKTLRCQSDSLMSVILDGETFYTHALDLKIIPKAVRIVCPDGIGFADYSQAAKGAGNEEEN